MKKGSFEAKKHSYRQTQDGIVISFVVHPDDVSSELALAPLGTIYMIGFAKVGDDSKPEGETDPEKKRRQFDSLQPSAQAAILCNDPEFLQFLMPMEMFNSDLDPAERIRRICEVKSRSEFNTDPKARNRWDVLRSQFEQFKTDRRYEASRTR